MTRPATVALALLCLSACGASAQAPPEQTPPIAPKIVETPLPPPVVLPGPPARPADVPDRPLTADEAARIALRNQPNVVIARAAVTAAEGRRDQARSGLLPSVGISAGYTHSDTLSSESGGASSAGTTTGSTGTTGGAGGTGSTTGGTVSVAPGYNASATVRQLVFDFRHTREVVRQAEAQERAASENLTRVQSDLVLQVKQAFYTYAENVRLIVVNESTVRNRQDQLALAQARLKAGLGLPIDEVRAQTAVSEAIFNLNTARNAADLARVSLALLMGIDPRTPIRAADGSEPTPPSLDVDALVRTALDRRPDVLQNLATVDAAKHGVSAAKTSNEPSLSANVGMTTRGTGFPPKNDFLNITAAIQWTPFDSGLTRGREKEARAGVTSAQSQLDAARLGVVSDVSQAYLNLLTAQQRQVTSADEVANAEESVRLAEGRYRAGIGTFLEVTDAESTLVTARTNQINASSAIDQARAALSHAIGAPLPTGAG